MLFRKRAPVAASPVEDLAKPLSFETLFDPGFLAGLKAFSLRIARAQKGGRLAEQRTNARGQGAEFADFKPYVAGDDLRAIDWNVYRRLGKVFVRVFEESQDMPVYILVDRSRSLYVEQPPRIHAAQRAALALSAVALDQHDSVGLFPFSDTMEIEFRAVSGKAGLARVAHSLAAYEAKGGTGLAAALMHLAGMRVRQGLVIVISDFFDEAGIELHVDDMVLERQHASVAVLGADGRSHPASRAEHRVSDWCFSQGLSGGRQRQHRGQRRQRPGS